MVKLRGEDIRSLPVPVVTSNVQEQVVASLEDRRQQTSKILSKLERQTELLGEHRQALITAAVTGQIEVPGTGESGPTAEEYNSSDHRKTRHEKGGGSG